MYVVNGIDLDGYDGLIAQLARRLSIRYRGRIEFGDLYNEGWLGLYAAATKHEPTRGDFVRYGYAWMKGRMMKAVSLAGRFAPLSEEALEADGAQAAIARCAEAESLERRTETGRRYVALFGRLTVAQREAMNDCFLLGKSVTRMAIERGCTVQAVSFLVQKGLRKLRRLEDREGRSVGLAPDVHDERLPELLTPSRSDLAPRPDLHKAP